MTCIDTPRVLPVAHALAERLGLSAQATFGAADLLAADFGADRYDLCLLGQITRYLTAEQNVDLFRSVRTALLTGGTLVLDVPITGEQSSEWMEIVSLLLWVNNGGGAHGFDEYRVWLEEAGFARVRQLSERRLTTIK